MKATIGVYDSHDAAEDAVKVLTDAGLDPKDISILGKMTENEENNQNMKIAAAEVGTGVVLGSVVGVLTGVGIFAIPGLGMLYGAGALVGAIAGIDFGLIGGGIASAFTFLGMKENNAELYGKFIQEGKFIVVAQGEQQEIVRAKAIIDEHAEHIHSEAHH